jgi:hypothetical protein
MSSRKEQRKFRRTIQDERRSGKEASASGVIQASEKKLIFIKLRIL